MPEHRLVQEWRAFVPDQAPYLFPADKGLVPDPLTTTCRSFEDYVNDPTFGLRSDTTLHTCLLPLPYLGSLERASIFLLALNPGLHASDYYAESHPAFRDRLLSSLYQQNAADEFPFLSLDPAFAWHAGFEYWAGKLNEVATALVSQRDLSYRQALSELAQNVAVLELLPYHSHRFGVGSLIEHLPSCQYMLDYVHTELAPRARRREILLVVTRSGQWWKLEEHEHIIVYGSGETRGARLNLRTRGGQAIARQLGLTVK